MDIYQQNLIALQKTNPSLVQQLSGISTNERYEVFQGDNPEAINILDTQTQEFLYDYPEKYNKTMQESFIKKREFPFLYFFGIGNGKIFVNILNNRKLERLIIIEPSLELLFIALHFNDFSSYLKNFKLQILLFNQLTYAQAASLFDYKNAKVYAKSYELFSPSNYYEKYFNENMIEANLTLIKALEQRVIISGNDITDSLTGVKHHIAYLNQMIKKPMFKDLLKQKNSDIAIIISTGPSLHKQLPLLKKIQNNATLISVDASLPVLEKNGIIPDIATSIERVELTSQFFKNISDEFKKNIIFVCATVEHPETMKTLNPYNLVPVMRPYEYNYYFKLEEYGYAGYGLSSANMAHEIAYLMGYKNIVLIGQDLAYGQDGNSHSAGHIFGSDEIKETPYDIMIDAYGKTGKIRSTKVWQIFLNHFSEISQKYINIAKTINATEGGAHIPGTIEEPFSKVIEKYIDKNLQKINILLNYPSSKIIEKNEEKIEQKITLILEEGTSLLNKLQTSLINLMKETQSFENKSEKDLLQNVTDTKIIQLLSEIENIRNTFHTSSISKNFLINIIQPNLLHIEIDLAEISTYFVDNPADNKKKALAWILYHRKWLFTLAGCIANTLDIINTEFKKSKEDNKSSLL